MIKQFEKERIMKMIKNNTLCICPSCRKKVYPRYVYYPIMGKSGLYWCPKCLTGNAGMFWKEV